MDEKVKLSNLNVKFPTDMKREMRIQAAQKGISMSELIRRILADSLDFERTDELAPGTKNQEEEK